MVRYRQGPPSDRATKTRGDRDVIGELARNQTETREVCFPFLAAKSQVTCRQNHGLR